MTLDWIYEVWNENKFSEKKNQCFQKNGLQKQKKTCCFKSGEFKKWVAKKISFGFKRKGKFEKTHEGQFFFVSLSESVCFVVEADCWFEASVENSWNFWMETLKRPISDSGNVLDRKLTKYEYDLKNKNIGRKFNYGSASIKWLKKRQNSIARKKWSQLVVHLDSEEKNI